MRTRGWEVTDCILCGNSLLLKLEQILAIISTFFGLGLPPLWGFTLRFISLCFSYEWPVKIQLWVYWVTYNLCIRYVLFSHVKHQLVPMKAAEYWMWVCVQMSLVSFVTHSKLLGDFKYYMTMLRSWSSALLLSWTSDPISSNLLDISPIIFYKIFIFTYWKLNSEWLMASSFSKFFQI